MIRVGSIKPSITLRVAFFILLSVLVSSPLFTRARASQTQQDYLTVSVENSTVFGSTVFGTAPLEVQFSSVNATSCDSVTGKCNPLMPPRNSFLWIFGDGEASIDMSPAGNITHLYREASVVS